MHPDRSSCMNLSANIYIGWQIIEDSCLEFGKTKIPMVPPKLHRQFRMVVPKVYWQFHIESPEWNIRSHLRLSTQFAPTRIPQFGISAIPCYYARKPTITLLQIEWAFLSWNNITICLWPLTSAFGKVQSIFFSYILFLFFIFIYIYSNKEIILLIKYVGHPVGSRPSLC